MDSPDKEKSRPAISDHESTEAPNIVGASNETTPDLDRSASDDDDNSIVLQTDDDVAEKQEEKSEVKLENDSSQDTGKSESEEEKFDEKLENDSTQDFGKSESDTISEKIESEDVDEKLESENINEEVESEDTEQHGSMGISVDADINNGIEEKSDKISKGRKRKASDSHSEAENCIENDDKRQKNDLDAVAKKIKEEPSFDDADLNLPPKETFGKGKRARIPNKRYSDITLGNRGANKSVENGSEKLESENDSMEITIKEEPLSPPKPVPKTKDKVDTSVQKKTKSAEMSDPRFLKPFKFGWRRELVWRATYENKPLGDIYYYTPQGKKIRSMREVADFLRNNKDLTLENFTYFKAPLGLNDPEKETIRDAKKPNPQSPLVKKVLAKASPKSPKLPSTTAAPPENVTSSKPTTPKVLSPKIASPKILSPKVSSPKISSPKISTPKISTPKISTPKIISPKIASSKISSPKIASPKVMSPKLSRPKITSPRLANQRLAAKTEPKITSPKLSSTRSAKAKVTSPKTSSPRILSPKQPVNETIEIPAKTRAAAKAAPKIKVPPKKDKRILQLEETMEVDTPPVKPTPPKKGRWAKAATSPAKPKKRTIKLSSITNSEEKEENNKFMDNYLQNLSYGYNTLLYVFQYLKVQDLLRAGCVCTMWRDIASHPMLWRTVRMKNSQVHSFQGLANSLKKHGTRHLDLRKMLLPNGGDEIWPEFSKAIEKVDTLRKIELCRCPASVVEKLAVSNSHLEVINAVTIKCESMNLEPLKALTNVRELRLKSTGGLTLTSNLDSLRDMKELRHLSLTSIRDLDRMNLRVIAELTNLESLDLGECTDFPKTFGSEILVKLDKLEKLRLEKGQGMCHTFEILDAVKDMECLEQLELVNFDIKAGFDKALGHCQNIKKLLIIPTYISQSATTNHMVLGGVLRLQKTLSHFVWGVTLELLRVTELFVDQCEEPEKKEKRDKKSAGNGDSIPVLKPVPLLIDKEGEIPPAHDPPQVEILALPSLQKLLMQNLPTTRVKILKIPFHATWRQSITDSVN